MNRLTVSALLVGLASPGLAQTSPFLFEVDPSESNWTWTATANGIAVNPTGGNQFQMFGTFDTQLGINGLGLPGVGSLDGGEVTIAPDVAGTILFLAAVRVEGLVLSPVGVPLDFGDFSTSDGTFAADFYWDVLAGTAIITPLFGSPTYVDLAGTATQASYTVGTITPNLDGTLKFVAPQDLRLELDDPDTGIQFIIDLVGTLTGNEVPLVTSLCFGDGSGAACPCLNPGNPGQGCANGTGSGATLAVSGSTSLSAADLSLVASGLVPGNAGLFFQGSAQLNAGLGTPFGDGLFCAGGTIVRLEARVANGSGVAGTTLDIGALGGVGAGDVRYYQIWYRDPVGTPCGSGQNLSQALALTWIP